MDIWQNQLDVLGYFYKNSDFSAKQNMDISYKTTIILKPTIAVIDLVIQWLEELQVYTTTYGFKSTTFMHQGNTLNLWAAKVIRLHSLHLLYYFLLLYLMKQSFIIIKERESTNCSKLKEGFKLSDPYLDWTWRI